MHPLFESVLRLKSHLLTFVSKGVFLDINGTLSDLEIYAGSEVDIVIVTHPDITVCKEMERLSTSRPKVFAIPIDLSTRRGIIDLHTYMCGADLKMVFWRYTSECTDINDVLTTLNGLMKEETTLHILFVDKNICNQYQKSRCLGVDASKFVLLDRGSELVCKIPQITVEDIIESLVFCDFRVNHMERLLSTSQTQGVNLTPSNQALANTHVIICSNTKVKIPK